jgi:lipopolysaccharide transport system ATP-binding protein
MDGENAPAVPSRSADSDRGRSVSSDVESAAIRSDCAVDASNLSKRYELYAAPRDRLKQFVFPRVQNAMRRAGSAVGLSNLRPARRYFQEFWALRGVSFSVQRGETFGIIGRNGSGKSTLLQILAGILQPTTGEVRVQGRVAALLELGSGFNPEFTGRENVMLNGRILGMEQGEIEARLPQIIDFADIGDFIDRPVKMYSSGMFVRLAFAVQAHIDASVVIIDEALAVGDIFFRQKCYARLAQLRDAGAAILLVSHSMPEIEQYCDRAMLLEQGVPRFVGRATEATQHFYLLHQAGVARANYPAATSTREPVAQEGADGTKALRREALLDLAGKTQIGTGQARCTLVALCNGRGEPRNVFEQGETAVFHYEFVLNLEHGVPICGVLFRDQRGVIVHGKNSWQDDREVVIGQRPFSRIVCRQAVKLNLAPGEYTFEVGLTAVTEREWENRKRISHEEMSAAYVSLCHIPSVSSFSVRMPKAEGIAILTHHGVADLPTSLSMTTY